ncbi:hypothetical protein DRN63_00225 [Nanoarchaeota archaeon]|nr:MAG: hypothetical protein DRN63_00225 [Nanoarchaeota archaeon]
MGVLVEDIVVPLVWVEDRPWYLREPYRFKRIEATLRLYPYLVVHYYVHDEMRLQGTGELLDSVTDEGYIVYDCYTGRRVGDKRLREALSNLSLEAVREFTFDCKSYRVEAVEPRISKSVLLQKAKLEIANRLTLKAKHKLSTGEVKTYSRRVRPEKVRIVRARLIKLPIWRVTYWTRGSFTYERIYLGTDGTVLKDDMEKCLFCKSSASSFPPFSLISKPKQTNYLCEACGAAICRDHAIRCSVCGKYFCPKHSIRCIECGEGFCINHAPQYICRVCGGVLCQNDYRICAVCGQAVCPRDSVACENCGRIVCKDHAIRGRKHLFKKIYFCSQRCKEEYYSR